MLRIGLYGGAFNPVHKGHISVAKSMLASGLIDELWFIPSASSPHKNDTSLLAFDKRIHLLRLALKPLDNVSICSIEATLAAPNYTLHTIKALKEAYPLFTFYWCIGSDSLRQFHTWHKYDEILKHAKLLVALRPGADYSDVHPDIMKNTQLIQHKPVDIASNEIIRLVNAKDEKVRSLLPAAVYKKIVQEGWYLQNN